MFTVELFNNLDICNIFLNLFIISSLFSGVIIISSTFLGFSPGFKIISSFDLVSTSVVLFTKTSLALWTAFLEAVFNKLSSVCNNCFSYCLANGKNPYPLICFLAFGSIEYRRISIY